MEAHLPFQKWESAYKAVQSVWKRDQIEVFQKRLESLQSTLALRILLVLNAKADSQADAHRDGFERLAYGNREIVEVMSINQAWLGSPVSGMQQGGDGSAGYVNRNTVGAILTLRNGDTKVLTQKDQPIYHTLGEPPDDSEQTFVTVKENLARTGGTIEVGNRRHDQIWKEILNALYFRQITDRVDEVSSAHRKTFEWVFRASAFEKNPWDDLPAWLETGTGCYWVNGKAGAGKSTFMKFIREDQRTKTALYRWANGAPLIVASFFFWNLGSKLQRSQIGLLRGLLFDVVEAQPDLAPHILPGLYQAVVRGREAKHPEPSFAELKKGFRNLVGLKNNGIKVCLFIDGIDEYDGDHAELSELFAGIPPDSGVKALLSSRPIPACVEGFSKCQKLQLQDLTKEDVMIYVTDRVSENTTFKQQLTSEDGPRAVSFLEEIVNKASGVFLWVIIVVQGVLDGLRNGDRIEELRTHLDGLPADLGKLYQHMLQKLNPVYRRQASEIFQRFFRSITLESEEPFTSMHLAHIESQDPETALSLPLHPLSIDQRYKKSLSMEVRIRGRCCGLVEVLHDYNLDVQLRTINSRITFLHRTVAEFLQNEEVWNGLLALRSKPKFEVNLSLLASYLIETKTHEIGEVVDTRIEPVWRNMRVCLQYGRLAETQDPFRTSTFIDELDKVMEQHWKSAKEFHAGNLTYMTTDRDSREPSHWGVSLFRTMDGIGDTPQYSESNESIYSVAAGYGLTNYLKHKLTRVPEGLLSGQIQQAVLMSVTGHARNFKANSSPRNKTSYARFLTDDADVPSENYVSITEFLLKLQPQKLEQERLVSFAWRHVLRLTSKLVEYAGGFWNSFVEEEFVLWCKLLDIFILLGADVNATIELGSREGAHRQSASLVIMTVFKQLPPMAISLRSIVASRDHLKTLLEARGARKKEWLNGKLLQGACKSTERNIGTEKDSIAPTSPEKRFLSRFRAFRRKLDMSVEDGRR